MTEFLGSAGSTQLLVLMSIPLTGAILIGGFLVYSIGSRAKKGTMKHGSQANSVRATESPQSHSGPPADDLNTDILFAHKRPSAFSDHKTAPPDPHLNMNHLNMQGQVESSSRPFNQEKVDIAARLGNNPTISQSAEPVELLRLLRDPRSGDLIIQIGEHRYAKLTEVPHKKTGQYILKLAAHLLAFTNGMIVTEAGLKSVYNPKVGETPQPIVAPAPTIASFTAQEPTSPPPARSRPTAPASQPSPETEATFLSSFSSQSTPQAEPATSSGGLFGRSKPASSLPTMLPALNLAKEINDIVQNRLIYSPLAGNPMIEITSAPDGGIRINVNGSFYASVDEVPDLEAKTLIQESIKQWERS